MLQRVQTLDAARVGHLLRSGVITVAGAFLIAIMSQLEIPLAPIPVTLQTMAVMLLGLYCSPKHAFSACLAYLGAASVGLPVLAGAAVHPLWMLSPSAGYLLAFPAAAFTISWVMRKCSSDSVWAVLLALLSGQVIIYALGLAVLSLYVNFSDVLYFGLLPFIPGGLIKVASVICIKNGTKKLVK